MAKKYLQFLAGVFVIQFFLSDSVVANSCQPMKLTEDALLRWYNPHPSPSDFKLPMPLGMSLVFTPIPLDAEGLYGDEKSTYVMGSKTPKLFETKLEVRIGSSISHNGRAQLLFGKYEVTKAQYISIMGKGVFEHGVKFLYERSKDPKYRNMIQKFISGDCEGVLTREIYNNLSEPLTFLSYRDYIEFLDAYNFYCISKLNCRRKMSQLGRNKDVSGFIRLPAEHEWEFVARGGRKFVTGELSKADFQADLPPLESGKTIEDYAHVNSDPPRLLPIGTLNSLWGVYDMLGNAQELMLNPFTAENGYGAVGGYVARGGHFRLPSNELRVPRRVELQVFRLDENKNVFVIQYFPLTGIRVVVGYPVIGAAKRLGDSSLLQDFLENYSLPSEAGDSAGNTFANSRILGSISDHEFVVREELSKEDLTDFYQVSLNEHSVLKTSLTSQAKLSMEITNEKQEVILRASSNAQGYESSPLLPGKYWIRLTPITPVSKEEVYEFKLSRELIPDTGIAQLDLGALTDSQYIVKTAKQYSGYVGSGDTVDTYPVVDGSNQGGLRFTLSKVNTSITITYLNDDLDIVRRVEFTPDTVNKSLTVNSTSGSKGFVQISTAANNSTSYALRVQTVEPYHKVFVKEMTDAISKFAAQNNTYSGNLDEAISRLYLPIQINEPLLLKVELINLTADVDLRVFDSAFNVIKSSHIRKGLSPEFFSRLLPPGNYFAEARLKSSDEISSFDIRFSKIKDSLTPSGIANQQTTQHRKIVQRNATELGSLDGEFKDVLILKSGITYFQFQLPNSNQIVNAGIYAVSLFNVTASNLSLMLENEYGDILSTTSAKPNDWHYLSKKELPAGNYYLKIDYDGAIGSEISIALNVISEPVGFQTHSTSAPDLSNFGRFVESQGDFQIYREGNRCCNYSPHLNIV